MRISKEFEFHVQMRPWYGSPICTVVVEATSLNSAIKKAIRAKPKGVWYWCNNEVVYTNQKQVDYFQKLNPNTIFYHY